MTTFQTVEGPVRLAVVGAGYWAVSNHLAQLARRTDVELVSVCRLGVAELDALRREFGFRIATEDAEEALAAGVDAAVIAGPNHLHAPHALAAIRRGLHVMVEKPIALTSRDAWEIVDAANERGLHFLVPHGWQYKPFVLRAKAHLDAGAVGSVQFATCHMATAMLDVFEGTDNYGTLDVAGKRIAPEPATWASAELGGGYAYCQMTHSLSLLLWLTGLRPTRVTPRVGLAESGIDIVDAAIVEFEGGAFGVATGTSLVPRSLPYQVDIRIYGDEGMLLLDVERERADLRRHDGRTDLEPVLAGSGDYECAIPPNRFVELIRGLSTENDSPGWAAARAVAVAEQLAGAIPDASIVGKATASATNTTWVGDGLSVTSQDDGRTR